MGTEQEKDDEAPVSLKLWGFRIDIPEKAITALRKFLQARTGVALMVGILSFMVGGGTSHAIWTDNAASSGSRSTEPAASVKIESPAPGSSVDRCISVSGSATYPAGDAVWIEVRSTAAPLFYVGGAVKITSTGPGNEVHWIFPAVIGSKKPSDGDFDITVAVLPGSLASYLQGMVLTGLQPTPGSGQSNTPLMSEYPADTQPFPGALATDSATVTKSAATANC